MVPGAGQLFKSLLTQGDNPVKTVKHHGQRGPMETAGLRPGSRGICDGKTVKDNTDCCWWHQAEERARFPLHPLMNVYN